MSKYPGKHIEHRHAPIDSLWRRKIPSPGHLDIELTERCNNNCTHCYINLEEHDQRGKNTELSASEWQEMLRQAAELGVLRVRFTGGEPLLREDFEEIYTHARKLGMSVMLFTNARLITPRLADLFSRIPPREKIEVTVYGMHQKSYEAGSQVPGSFSEFRQGIDLLLQKQIPFVLKGALMAKNLDELDEFDKWSATIPWMVKPPQYVLHLEFRGRRDSKEKNQRIRSLRLSSAEELKILLRHEEFYLSESTKFCQQFIGPPGEKLFTCGAGISGCIDAYGRLQPCISLRHPEMVFELKNGTLRKVFQEFFPSLRETCAKNPEYLHRCAKCFLKGLCEQCPARSWSEHGTLDTPVEYLCQIAHAQARHLGLLKEGENGWEISDWRWRLQRMKEKRK